MLLAVWCNVFTVEFLFTLIELYVEIFYLNIGSFDDVGTDGFVNGWIFII